MPSRSRRRIEGLAALVGLGALANVFRSLETNQRVSKMLRYDQSFAAMGLRIRTWLLGCASLFGLAAAIRYLYGRLGYGERR